MSRTPSRVAPASAPPVTPGVGWRRPGPVRAWRIERAKGRTGWFIVAATLVALVGQGVGGWNYLRYRDEYFTTPELGWIAIWVQGSILVTTLFLPMVYVIVQANAAAAEFEYRGWLRIMATDRLDQAIAGKLLYALELACLGMGIYAAGTLVTGLVLGVGVAGVHIVLIRTVVAVAGAWSIGATMMCLGVCFTSFPAMTIAGASGTVVGLAVIIGDTPLDHVIPFSLITVGMGAREGGSDLDPGAAMLNPVAICATTGIALAWTAAATLGTRWLLRHREW